MPCCPVCRSAIHRDGVWNCAGECGHAELDCGGLPPQGRVDLGELVVGAGEADLQSVDFAEPALAFGFGDAVVEVAADLLQAGALRWGWPQERASDRLNRNDLDDRSWSIGLTVLTEGDREGSRFAVLFGVSPLARGV